MTHTSRYPLRWENLLYEFLMNIWNRSLQKFKQLPLWLRCVLLTQIFLLVWLQADLWFGYGGVRSLLAMKSHIQEQKIENNRLYTRNAQLDREVQMLKIGPQVTEEKARLDLGMVKDGETFFLWVD